MKTTNSFFQSLSALVLAASAALPFQNSYAQDAGTPDAGYTSDAGTAQLIGPTAGPAGLPQTPKKSEKSKKTKAPDYVPHGQVHISTKTTGKKKQQTYTLLPGSSPKRTKATVDGILYTAAEAQTNNISCDTKYTKIVPGKPTPKNKNPKPTSIDYCVLPSTNIQFEFTDLDAKEQTLPDVKATYTYGSVVAPHFPNGTYSVTESIVTASGGRFAFPTQLWEKITKQKQKTITAAPPQKLVQKQATPQTRTYPLALYHVSTEGVPEANPQLFEPLKGHEKEVGHVHVKKGEKYLLQSTTPTDTIDYQHTEFTLFTHDAAKEQFTTEYTQTALDGYEYDLGRETEKGIVVTPFQDFAIKIPLKHADGTTETDVLEIVTNLGEPTSKPVPVVQGTPAPPIAAPTPTPIAAEKIVAATPQQREWGAFVAYTGYGMLENHNFILTNSLGQEVHTPARQGQGLELGGRWEQISGSLFGKWETLDGTIHNGDTGAQRGTEHVSNAQGGAAVTLHSRGYYLPTLFPRDSTVTLSGSLFKHTQDQMTLDGIVFPGNLQGWTASLDLRSPTLLSSGLGVSAGVNIEQLSMTQLDPKAGPISGTNSQVYAQALYGGVNDIWNFAGGLDWSNRSNFQYPGVTLADRADGAKGLNASGEIQQTVGDKYLEQWGIGASLPIPVFNSNSRSGLEAWILEKFFNGKLDAKLRLGYTREDLTSLGINNQFAAGTRLVESDNKYFLTLDLAYALGPSDVHKTQTGKPLFRSSTNLEP